MYSDYDEFWTPELDVPTPVHFALAPRLVGPTICDVGCGTGQLALARPDIQWVGVDGAILALRAAQKRGVAVLLSDVSRSIPLGSRSVREISCLEVIEHLADPRQLLEEIARVLAPGGTAWLSTPNAQYLKHLVTLIQGRMFVTSDATSLYRGGHLQHFTQRDVVQLAEAAGLNVAGMVPVYANRFARQFRRVPLPLWVQRYCATGFLYMIRKEG